MSSCRRSGEAVSPPSLPRGRISPRTCPRRPLYRSRRRVSPRPRGATRISSPAVHRDQFHGECRMTTERIESAYELARERYAAIGVDTAAALEALARMPVSLHCWQGDDVRGFESVGEALGGGLAA